MMPRPGPGPGVLQAAAVAADGHAHFRVLRLDAQLGEQPQQGGVGPFVVDDEAGVDPEDGTVRLRDVVGVGVAAQPAVRLEEGDVSCRFRTYAAVRPATPLPIDGDSPSLRRNSSLRTDTVLLLCSDCMCACSVQSL